MKIHPEHDPIHHSPALASVAQLDRPPTGWTTDQLFSWTEEFANLLEELRCSGEEALSEEHRQYLIHTLDFSLAAFEDLELSHCALDLVREYAALHVQGADNRTAAERALEKIALYPPRLQSYLEALTYSHWDLYEVVSVTSGAFELRRLHDDSIHWLQAPEMNQPFFIGHVVALRLIEMEEITTAPLAIQFDQERLTELVSVLETEFAAGAWRAHEWTDFMIYRGSFLILRHALADLLNFDRFDDEDLVEEGDALHLPPALYLAMEQAFASLEYAFYGESQAMEPFLRKTPTGQVVRVEEGGQCPILLVFPNESAHHYYERYMAGDLLTEVIDNISFLRLWRLPANLLPDDELDELIAEGLELHPFGVALPTRVDPGLLFEDVTAANAMTLIEACRLVAQMINRANKAA